MTVSRRAIIQTFLLAMPMGIVAPQAVAQSRDIPAEKIFAFLKNYYSLPSSERTHFKLGYRLKPTSGSLNGVSLVLNHKGQKLPLRLATNGDILNIPSATAMADKATLTFNAPKGTKFSIILFVLSSLKPEKILDASEMILSITQAAKGAKKAAGLAGGMIPKLECILFEGTTLGQAELSDGRALALPRTTKGVPYFAAADWPKAVRVVLDQVPALLEVDQKEKKKA